VAATLILGAALLLVGCFVLTGCTGQPLSTREKGTLGGGVLGAGAGAIVGPHGDIRTGRIGVSGPEVTERSLPKYDLQGA
jgi:hypothetical protein